MNFGEYLSYVEGQTGLNSEDAGRVIAATLQSFAGCLSAIDVNDVATQLPEEAREFLLRGEPLDPCSADIFFDRVSELAGISYEQAKQWSRPVMYVVQRSVSVGEFDDIRRGLPEELAAELFPSREPRVRTA